ncbi:rhodanese-like domain-containing protein [Roseibium marinum]|uniref:Rhodanese-related sulfurtransferase n=1 Tax=Roseibium marinum TaxID=281252 RepID=A0A2S3V220_9HYPH|nr:thiosulfate sulfurtransferase GlpE [Roseibium marinum]POF33833.1 rhodanese-related sulfurtransferase [Roseibium marinum]
MIPRKDFQRINVQTARELASRDDVLIIDVRDVKAYKKQHIPEARNVSINNLAAILDSAPRDMPVLIYCYRGYASQDYARAFSDFRFQEVYSLDGGYDAWHQSEIEAQDLDAQDLTLKTMALV